MKFEPLVPATIVPFLRYCLEHARRNITVEEVAAAMGVHRKTLVDRLKAAHLPSPRAMIGWCRLLMAARLLDDPGRTIDVAMLAHTRRTQAAGNSIEPTSSQRR